jgi:hypothetical protein
MKMSIATGRLTFALTLALLAACAANLCLLYARLEQSGFSLDR